MEQERFFREEEKRLDFTKKYMQAVIKTSETSKDQFKKNMQEAFNDADWGEGSLYSQLLTASGFFEMSQVELDSLKKAQKKPYFARVDFVRDNSPVREVLYFGKTSLYQRENQEQLIVDWRSPIANLYYEGRLGKVAYEVQEEQFIGEIMLKRQLMIEEGILKEIRDIDMTTTDELLQESLSRSSTSRLTEIVSTIQEEQNKIIRADLDRPIIVQGAAGSGKTTIALHRISYFIYTYKDRFNPADLMILAPSMMFLDYISEALPELGVEKAKQFTFADYVQYAAGCRLKLAPDTKLTDILEKEEGMAEAAVRAAGIKGSSLFKSILDAYLREIFQRFHPISDFYCDKYRLYTARKFIRLLEEEYQYLPLYRRLDKLKKVLSAQVRAKRKQMEEKVSGYYDTRIERALLKPEGKARREYVTKCLDRKEERMTHLNKEIKTAAARFFKDFEKKNLLVYYDELYAEPEKLAEWSGGRLSCQEAEELCAYQSSLRKRKRYESEDMAPMLYLHAVLFGVDPDKKPKNVIIDEAQDYSFMALCALKAALGTDMFTLVGDLAQGIHSYRGLNSWDEVRKEVFPRASYMELQKSYRTTVEIMEAANRILGLLPFEFPKAEPVVRHGEPPLFYRTSTRWAEQIIGKAEELYQEGFRTFAVITKTMADCKKAFKELKKLSPKAVLLEEDSVIPKDSIAVLPSYSAKGLEFDSVFALSLDECYQADRELDIKLLYVVMTRPLHRLFLYGKQPDDFLLGWVDVD